MLRMSRFFAWLLISLLLIASFSSGCNATKSAQGGAIGAGAGGALGGIIGAKKDNTAVGAIIGAAVGGTAGALIGRYMDQQAEELEDKIEGAEVNRVGEGILVTFDSGLLFDFDSDDLRAQTRDNLEEMPDILQEYEDTQLLVEGHTDDVGSDTYNQALSRDRAQSVARFLSQEGVNRSRMVIKGYGEAQPVADNDTEKGRQQNRRVEIAIYADEDLKERAQEGELSIGE
mgnify:CR=1 FL=1